MSGPNQMPSINRVNFFENQSGNNHIHNINTFRNDTFELSMELVLGGLNLLEHDFYPFQDFYINVVTYTQRGYKDIVIHGLRSEKFDLDRIRSANNGEERLIYFINKFRHYPYEELIYDFKFNIYWVEVFYSTSFIENVEELESSLFGNLTLFKTKIPYSNKLEESKENE